MLGVKNCQYLHARERNFVLQFVSVLDNSTTRLRSLAFNVSPLVNAFGAFYLQEVGGRLPLF